MTIINYQGLTKEQVLIAAVNGFVPNAQGLPKWAYLPMDSNAIKSEITRLFKRSIESLDKTNQIDYLREYKLMIRFISENELEDLGYSTDSSSKLEEIITKTIETANPGVGLYEFGEALNVAAERAHLDVIKEVKQSRKFNKIPAEGEV